MIAAVSGTSKTLDSRYHYIFAKAMQLIRHPDLAGEAHFMIFTVVYLNALGLSDFMSDVLASVRLHML